ncbi:MAG: SCO family protein [Nitrospinota bacterium]
MRVIKNRLNKLMGTFVTCVLAVFMTYAVMCDVGLSHAGNASIADSGAVSSVPDSGGDFTLTNHFGKKMRLCDFKGKVVLLFFGFTFCPDICPTGLIELDAALEELGDRKKEVQVLFISVDPERDTPEVLKEFVTYFNSTFIGLTGTPQEIRSVTEQYGVKFEKVSVEGGGDYLLRHSANTYVIDAEGDLVDTIPHKHAAGGDGQDRG